MHPSLPSIQEKYNFSAQLTADNYISVTWSTTHRQEIGAHSGHFYSSNRVSQTLSYDSGGQLTRIWATNSTGIKPNSPLSPPKTGHWISRPLCLRKLP